jgi:multicomponent K+:H+ antiporter subunit E
MSFTKWIPHPILTLVLWITWLLLQNSLSAGHILLGLILALLIPWLTSGFWPERIRIQKPWILIKFTGVVLWDILIANIAVAKLILSHNDTLKPGFIELELDIQTPIGISLLANTISLTPGTVSCDLSADRKHLIIHALHLEDPEATINEIKQRYEQPLIEVFKSC